MTDRPKHEHKREREEGVETSSQASEVNGKSPKRTAVEKEDEGATLAKLLVSMMFSSRPKTAERQAVRYLVDMRWEPVANAEAFITNLRGRSPTLAIFTLANIWTKFKQFFDGQQQQIYQPLRQLMDVDGMVEAFQAASYIEVQGEASAEQGLSQPTRARSRSTVTGSQSAATRSSLGNSNSNSTSSSSSSHLSPGAIKRMRLEYEQHGNDFTCTPWVVPSGADVDAVIAGHVLTLVTESPMHSYVITDPHTILKLFSYEGDRLAVGAVLNRRTGDSIWRLPASQEHYLSLYDKAPEALKEMLDMGCLGVIADARAKEGEQCDLPDRSFCSLAHRLIDQLFRVYERNKFQLQSRKSESWFRENLWANLHDIFNVPDELSYEPGEVHCQASARRKNRERESTLTKQQAGRKADGLVSSTEPSCELLVVEAANTDNGPQGTKAMNDTLKLSKMTKDMFDVILEKVGEQTQDKDKLKNARDCLSTFGLRFSAGSLALYSLKKLPEGRYYVLRCEGVLTFPSLWKNDGSNTSTILTVLSTLLALKHRLLQMAKQIEGWTKVSFTLPEPVGVEDRAWPATLSTPAITPRHAASTPSSSSTSSALAPPSPLRI
ncbi:hypothetical protein BGZ72_009994 [Mortierella alpina]|nr:hypothetical protein BGZ72_009994 [Mortierella alpina]